MKFLQKCLPCITSLLAMTQLPASEVNSTFECIPAKLIFDENPEYAEISVDFIPGTAFIAWIVTRDSDSKRIHDYGTYGVNGHWQAKLPKNSRVMVGVQGFANKYCRYFEIKNTTYANLNFWGTCDLSHYEITEGDAVEFEKEIISLNRCPDP